MKKLLIAIMFIAISLGASVFLFMQRTTSEGDLLKASSDTNQYDHVLTVNIDSWKGYKILCSNVMSNMLRQHKIRLKCVDDGADYEERMSQLSDKKIQFAAVEVGSYVKKGKDKKYPASIMMVIDTSNQGDSLLAYKPKVATIDELRKKTDAKLGLTMDSPSEVFGKVIANDYGLKTFENSANIVGTNDASDAMKQLLTGQLDAAIVWEPYRSLALKDPNIVELVSTRDSQDTIVDALVVERQFGENNPDVVKTIIVSYFKTLKYYNENKEELVKEILSDDDVKGLKKEDIESMISGIHWSTLTENCTKWFACDPSDWSAKSEIVNTLKSTLKMWNSYNDISGNPFPRNDAYNLINSKFVADVFENGIVDVSGDKAYVDPLTINFSAWTDQEWNKAKVFGKLKNDPIVFRENTELRLSSKDSLDSVAEVMKRYPNFRIIIFGHTGTTGDQVAKMKLSQDRADWVKRYLEITYSMDKDRIKSVGKGGTAPLPLEAGESKFNRAYQGKLPRVEIFLIKDKSFDY